MVKQPPGEHESGRKQDEADPKDNKQTEKTLTEQEASPEGGRLSRRGKSNRHSR